MDLVLTAWIALSAALGALGVFVLESQAFAVAAMIAIAPALATLAALDRLERPFAQALVTAAWTASATAATGITGGAGSPLAAALLIWPLISLRLWGKAGEAAAFAVLGYALAALAGARAPMEGAFELPASLFVAPTLALCAALLALPRAAPKAAPAPVETPLSRVAEVSHELRTPLNHIIGFAETMRAQVFGPLPSKYAEYAGLIADAGRRLLDLVNDWLDAARLASGRYDIRREACDLAAIAAEAVRAAQDSAPDRQILLVAPQAAPAHVDPRATRQILDNLIANGIKFSPTGRRVIVAVGAARGVAAIEVEDDGPGIPDSEKERLSQPFERGRDALGVEGSGLGLALVKGLAEAHGGRLTISDGVAGGARLRATLPEADETGDGLQPEAARGTLSP